MRTRLALLIALCILCAETCLGAFVNVQGWVYFHNGTAVPTGTSVNISQLTTEWKGTVVTGGPSTNYYFQLGVQAADAGTDIFRSFSWSGMFNGSTQRAGLNGPEGFLTINITYSNIAPRWNATLPDKTILEDSSGLNNAIYLRNFTYDLDGNISSYSIASQSNAALATASVDGNYIDIGAPSANLSGTSTVCVRAYDGEDYSTQDCLVITVTAVEDLPGFTTAADNVTATYTSNLDFVRIGTIARDMDNQNVRLYVCNTSSATALGCTNTQYCTALSLTNPNCSFSAPETHGVNTWYAFIYDTNGNAAGRNFNESIRIDSISPTAGAVTANYGRPFVTDGTFAYNFSGFSDVGSGIYRYHVSDTDPGADLYYGEQLLNTSSGSTITVLNETNTTLYVWARDRVGHYSGVVTSNWVLNDMYSPIINPITTEPDTLEEVYIGDLTIYAYIYDSASGLNSTPKMRFRFNSTSYSSWFTGTLVDTRNYSFNVTVDWRDYAEESLIFQINATDNVNRSNISLTSIYVEKYNYAPALDFISNYAVDEDSTLRFTITATDQDATDVVYFYVNRLFTITALSTRSANASWTPINDYVGSQQVIFRATDTIDNDTQSVIITVNPTNDPPVLLPVGDWEGYLHIPFREYFKAYDIDNNNVYQPDNNILLFDIISNVTWLNVTTYLNATDNNYTGYVNFDPLLSYVGRQYITIFVSDGEDSDSENITLTIGTCGDLDEGGDPWCQSDYEDCESCPDDCGECTTDTVLNKLTILVDPRNCVDRNFTVKTFESWRRATCPTEGLIVWGSEVCKNLSGVSLDVYILENRQWEKLQGYVSNANGEITFIPDSIGEYKLIATKTGYPTTFKYLEIGPCLGKEGEEPETPKANETPKAIETQKPLPKKTPKEEIPGEEEVEKSIVWQIFLFIIIGACLTAATVTGYFYYNKEKNNNAYILKARIYLMKLRKKAVRFAKEYWKKLKEFLGFRT